MNDDVERDLLITEIVSLEESIIGAGRAVPFPPDVEFFKTFSTNDLRAIRNRFERLVRSLGGLRQ